MIHTPRGLWPASCLHHVPDGSRIGFDGHGQQKHIRIRHANGTSTQHLPCQHLSRRLTVTETIPEEEHTFLGFDRAYPVYWTGAHRDFSQFSAVYPVPSVPLNNLGQALHWWIGAEDAAYQVVIQPVLTWIPEYGSRWVHAAWNCCPLGHQFHGDLQWADVGETVSAQMEHLGSEQYRVSTAGAYGSSTLLFDDGLRFTIPQLTLETTIMNRSCGIMPPGEITMRDIRIDPPTAWQDSWFEADRWRIEECGWTVEVEHATNSSTIALRRSPPMPPSAPPLPSSPPTPPPSPPSSLNIHVVVAASLMGGAVLSALVCLLIYWSRRRRAAGRLAGGSGGVQRWCCPWLWRAAPLLVTSAGSGRSHSPSRADGKPT
jgi:hypothetical protein